jgi:hypothetical protein
MGQGGPKYCVRGMNGLTGNGPGRGIDRSDGWPAQVRFWLEWGCSDSLNSVIPTGANQRKVMIHGL